MSRKCFLRCLSSLHPDVLLPDGMKVAFGRGPTSKIKDTRCSREQITLTADYAEFSVSVAQLGKNASSLNGAVIGQGGTSVARHGDVVEVLEGEFPHKVLFDPAPTAAKKESAKASTPKKSSQSTATSSPVIKRAASSSEPKSGSSKRLKLNMKAVKMNSTDLGTWYKLLDDKVYIFCSSHCEARSKIAAFDMDNTLICTQSGKVFPVDHNDWKILYPEVPRKLKDLHSQGYKIVILTNQAGLAKGKMTIGNFQTKVERMATKLSVPLQLFCAADEGGFFRKPRTGLWNCLEEAMNGDLQVDRDSSFYCGDAAGREQGWIAGRKKDFSCSDRLLALNLGLAFTTPEETFLGHKATAKFVMPEFDPRSVRKDAPLLEPSSAQLASDKQEVIVLVGIQGSGKSHLSESLLAPLGYVVASNDRTGGRDKTVKVMETALKAGKSVVVDNTHADRESRRKFVAAAGGVPCRCFVMTTTAQHARHNNVFRELTGQHHAKIKEPLFYSFKNKYEEPTTAEGFTEIVRVNFVPEFKNAEEEALYTSYLLEK